MSLKLMYITNNPDVAQIAQQNGVDRIFLDMEYIGKAERQGNLDSVKNRHTIEDVKAVREVLLTSDLLVRVNPIHDATEEYGSTEEEIDAVIDAGADIVMLPYFKTLVEVERFYRAVNRRVKTILLLETKEAVQILPAILELKDLDEIHIGLNDLSISYGKKFMFELLADGTVDALAEKIRAAGLPFGLGGIARPGGGALPAERSIREHVRLGSTRAILSRAFCNTQKETDPEKIRMIFTDGIREIRAVEDEAAGKPESWFTQNREELQKTVAKILEGMP